MRNNTESQDYKSNTSNLFLCGSPLGIFLHLDQAQIMPRKGRERTMRMLQTKQRYIRKLTLRITSTGSPQDEAVSAFIVGAGRLY